MGALLALALWLMASAAPPAVAQSVPVYANDFSGGASGGATAPGVSATWSSGSTDVTPSGRYGRFLGRFSNDSVSLTLTGLPAHRFVTVAFRLFIIQSMDGNDTTFGPDFWEFGVVGGPRFLRTTFTNVPDFRQSYPGAFPSDFPARSGASERDTLGYDFFGDSVYVLGRTVAHSGGSITFYFAGSGQDGIDGESWGLDDVIVTLVR
jgi:hypothetical protein